MKNKFKNYQKMYEDFGAEKRFAYVKDKFIPWNFFGFDNFLRERKMLEKIDLRKRNIVLDIGCASGRQTVLMSAYCQKVVGIDVSSSFIQQGKKNINRQKINNVELLVASVENLPFSKYFFDKVLCAEILEHIIDVDKALREISRVMRRKGKLVITVPNFNSDGTIYGRIKRILKIKKFEPLENFSFEGIQKHGDAHLREFNKKSIIELVKKYNFSIIEISNVSFLDWPGIDLMIKGFNKLGIWQKCFLRIFLFLEFVSSKLLYNFGRHLILVAEKQ